VNKDVTRWEAGLLVVRVGCAYDFHGRRSGRRTCEGGLVSVEPCCEEEGWGGEEALECCGWGGTEEVCF
jgi:hypothetical protein